MQVIESNTSGLAVVVLEVATVLVDVVVTLKQKIKIRINITKVKKIKGDETIPILWFLSISRCVSYFKLVTTFKSDPYLLEKFI